MLAQNCMASLTLNNRIKNSLRLNFQIGCRTIKFIQKLWSLCRFAYSPAIQCNGGESAVQLCECMIKSEVKHIPTANNITNMLLNETRI